MANDVYGCGCGCLCVGVCLPASLQRDAMDVLYLYTRGPQVPHVREANKRWQEENIWITTKK